ncbi:choice-of-anchor I family protein [Bremerella sp. JC770]|uniref:choice-of-anchor I family protein n=1 Tax=Bremerella sp. JC770 TaxID=3232137 RepID=UPI0034595894
MKLFSMGGAALASLVLAGSAAAGPLDFLLGTPTLEESWRYTAAGGEGACEIAAYDVDTQKVFVTNAADETVDVLDAANGDLLHQIAAGDVNSVACYEGVVAIAVAAETGVRGKVILLDAEDYSVFSEPEAGFLPDMVTFTPNGKYVLVANEGEPDDDYLLDPVGSVSIIDVTDPTDPEVFEAGFESFNGDEAALKAAGVRIFGPGASVAQDMEPEYIAVSANSRTAYVSCQENNAIAVVNIPAKRIVSINPLGFKDHSQAENAMDASDDDDGTINIQPWPTKGVYMPDAIASTRFLGFTLIASANEGDARDYDGFAEEERIKDLVLDEDAFPDAEFLQEDENLGRLNVTTTLGDIDNDGDYDELYSFGARSFSIWLFTPFGQTVQVYDSGSDFEDITAAQVPEFFNSDDGDADNFDNRSDAKGPEPEAIDIGSDLGCTWAFIGLERVGGIMLYDISNPLNPSFVEYSRNLIDIAPEGIDFIARGDGPFTEPAIVVSHEFSGTTTLFKIKRTGGLLSNLLND